MKENSWKDISTVGKSLMNEAFYARWFNISKQPIKTRIQEKMKRYFEILNY